MCQMVISAMEKNKAKKGTGGQGGVVILDKVDMDNLTEEEISEQRTEGSDAQDIWIAKERAFQTREE